MHERACRQSGNSRVGDDLEDGVVADLLALTGEDRQAGGAQRPDVVVLAPHDALGHAGGAARVDHEDVVARTAPGGHDPLGLGGDGLLVGDGPLGALVGAVVDPQPLPDLRHPVPDRLDAVGEAAVEHDGHGVRVLPQVRQLVVEVPVVGVHRDQAGLVAGERRLEVLRRVEEVDGDLVLVDGTVLEQEAGQAVGPPVEVGPRVAAVAMDLCRCVTELVRDPLPQLCVVPAAHQVPPVGQRPRPWCGGAGRV